MIFLKPISKGNFRLPLLVDREENLFCHGHSMHPTIHAPIGLLGHYYYHYSLSLCLQCFLWVSVSHYLGTDYSDVSGVQ